MRTFKNKKTGKRVKLDEIRDKNLIGSLENDSDWKELMIIWGDEMAKLMWCGLDKNQAKRVLDAQYKPADPKAYIKKEGKYYSIYANAKMDMVPIKVVKK